METGNDSKSILDLVEERGPWEVEERGQAMRRGKTLAVEASWELESEPSIGRGKQRHHWKIRVSFLGKWVGRASRLGVRHQGEGTGDGHAASRGLDREQPYSKACCPQSLPVKRQIRLSHTTQSPKHAERHP